MTGINSQGLVLHLHWGGVAADEQYMQLTGMNDLGAIPSVA